MAKSPNLIIGIECESLEHDTWGIARMTRHTLEEIAHTPELHANAHYILYSKGQLPNDPLYQSPCFTQRPLAPSWLKSFSLYYFILLPLRMVWDRLSCMYLPNYMLPWPSPIPTLVMMTDDVWQESRNPNVPLRYRIAYRIFACFFSATYATRIMAISHASQVELSRLLAISPQRCVVNHLGVSYVPTSLIPTTPSHRYILSVGQAFERRNTQELVEAFGQIAIHDQSLSLVLVGPDRYHPLRLAATITSVAQRIGEGRILWHEQVSQETLSALMLHAQCIVYCSDREAFGLPPLEGLAQGTVPVVADAPVSREILGNLAIFVSPLHNVHALVQGITQALSDTNLRMRIASERAPHIQRFTWQRHAQLLVDTLRSIAK